MSTPTLRRFLIAYTAMLLLMLSTSGYAVFQLGKLSSAAHIALTIEQRMIDQLDQLVDAFLSEVRYGGKFAATQSVVQYEQYKQFKVDFERYLTQLKTLATGADESQHLSRIEEYHAQYNELFEKEVEYIRANQPYAESRYREEKERLVDYLLREHEALKSNLETSLQQRIGFIEEAARENQKLTLGATLVLAVLGVIFAYWLAGIVPDDLLSSARSQIAICILHLRSFSWWKGFGISK